MSLGQHSPRWLALGVGLAMATSVLAQPATYEPKVGQPGKDVVWVPTPQELVNRMLDMAKVTPQDYLVDLGSGDGRTVITAAKRGLKAHGVEYNPDMVELAKRNAAQARVSDKATFEHGDIFKTDFSQATVVTLFLLPQLNLRLRPTLLDMKPGTRVVSNSFTMGDWEPDDSVSVAEGCTSFCKAYLWIVPAKVGGAWTLGESQLKLDQGFQMLSGTLSTGNVVAPVNGKLKGDQITFTAAGREYTGRVRGDSMVGTSAAGGSGETKWLAQRK